jgi:xylulose-5-phosphate/fructose-6-phosphate phosphoketolase
LLRARVPDLRIRVVNVVDLLALQPTSEHPHGLADEDFDALFTADKPVIFAFHGYPTLIHRLTYRRRNHNNIHVRGYVEEGTTTTPFDMAVLNRMDRFRLALDVVLRVPRLAHLVEPATQQYSEAMQRHKEYVSEHGEDLPEIRNWKWSKS